MTLLNYILNIYFYINFVLFFFIIDFAIQLFIILDVSNYLILLRSAEDAIFADNDYNDGCSNFIILLIKKKYL